MPIAQKESITVAFEYNGRAYYGKYSASEGFLSLLFVLGVKPTEKVLASAFGLAGKSALYKSAVSVANESTVVALKALALVESAVAAYKPAKNVESAFTAWQASHKASASMRATIVDTLAQAKALEKSAGLPAGTITANVAKNPPALAETEALYSAYAMAVHAQFLARVTSMGKQAKASAEVLVFAKNSASTVVNMEAAGIVSASVKGRGNGRRTGNGTRVRFVVPTTVAGLPWAGNWRRMAAVLYDAGLVEKGGNFANHPALGRAARELKDKTFTFAGGREHKGAFVLANIAQFVRETEAPAS